MVDDYFTVNDLNVEFTAAHADRGQIQVKLTAPDGTTRIIIATSADTWNNYDITLDGDSGGALNDVSDDNTATPIDRTVQQTLLNDFDGKNAHGHWTMTICDNTFNATGTAQLFIQARLVFDGTAFTPTPPQHKQGLGVVETYFVPWPEDQVWTAMGEIFPSSCANYAGFRDNYDAAPRQPMVGYTVITITDAGTVITYDQWEDGYEPILNFPTQATTQVWGDGDLLNGVAPGDADDILTAGQVLTLNDVMLSTTLGTVIDFDARDKVAASMAIAITRSIWSDGSQTMFATADEAYPTTHWGTQFYSPVGDNANLNGMFDFSGVSIMAATDGTLVDIDKDANGIYETTGIALSQGGTYFIDDNTNGMYRGGGIRSNTGHPIQVNLMTANVCAGFESRTYPLMPYDQWDSSYYSPVGTLTTSGGPGADDAPTTVHLYNPGTSAITVNYAFATGGTSTVSVPGGTTGGGANVVMQDLSGAQFYTNPIITTNNVRDTFATRAYTRQDGSVNWATDWDETGDDDNATAGSIQVRTAAAPNTLSFNFQNAVATGDTIERQSFDMTGYTSATLSFAYTNNGRLEATDIFRTYISNNGGSTWTQLGSNIPGNTSGTFSQDISSYISSNTRVRFEIYQRSGDSDRSEWFNVDNGDISFSKSNSAPVFYAIASVDSDNASGAGNDQNSVYDWGYTLVPERVMSKYLIVGWAPGDDPTFQGSLAENTAPIWLTGGHPQGSAIPDASFTVCVDYNGDGGPTLDPISGRFYNASTSVAPLSLLKIYKDKLVPPGTGSGTAGEDQTGTQIWVCDGSDAVLTAAWGEDALVSSPSKPGLDMGYTIRNRGSWNASKGVSMLNDVDSSGTYTEGDRVRYTITVTNLGLAILANILNITDALPSQVSYVANSTHLINHLGADSLIPDSGSGTPFPLDVSGYTYNQILPTGRTFTVYFDATINTGVVDFPYQVINVATVTDGTSSLHPDALFSVQAGPTAITVSQLDASVAEDSIHVSWQTYSEMEMIGFALYRAVGADATQTLVFQGAANHPGKLLGDNYEYTDMDVLPGGSYTYWLIVLLRDGSTETQEPITVSLLFANKIFLPILMR